MFNQVVKIKKGSGTSYTTNGGVITVVLNTSPSKSTYRLPIDEANEHDSVMNGSALGRWISRYSGKTVCTNFILGQMALIVNQQTLRFRRSLVNSSLPPRVNYVLVEDGDIEEIVSELEDITSMSGLV